MILRVWNKNYFKKYLSLLFFFITICLFSNCVSRNSVNNKTIVDTLHFGSFYKSKNVFDLPLFSVIDSESGKSITSVKEGENYNVLFKVSNFQEYAIIPKVLENGSLIPSNVQNEYILKVSRNVESNILEIQFELDLKQDSIVILHRNWDNKNQNSYSEELLGFNPRALLKIKIK